MFLLSLIWPLTFRPLVLAHGHHVFNTKKIIRNFFLVSMGTISSVQSIVLFLYLCGCQWTSIYFFIYPCLHFCKVLLLAKLPPPHYPLPMNGVNTHWSQTILYCIISINYLGDILWVMFSTVNYICAKSGDLYQIDVAV